MTVNPTCNIQLHVLETDIFGAIHSYKNHTHTSPEKKWHSRHSHSCKNSHPLRNKTIHFSPDFFLLFPPLFCCCYRSFKMLWSHNRHRTLSLPSLYKLFYLCNVSMGWILFPNCVSNFSFHFSVFFPCWTGQQLILIVGVVIHNFIGFNEETSWKLDDA